MLSFVAGWLAGWVIVWHGKNFNVAIFSKTLNVINVKHCMMVVLIELYLLIPPFGDLDHISKSHQCQTDLTQNFMFLSYKLKLNRIVQYINLIGL